MNQTDNNKAVATFFVVVFSVVEGDTSHRHNSWCRIYLVISIYKTTTETCEGDEVDKGTRDWYSLLPPRAEYIDILVLDRYREWAVKSRSSAENHKVSQSSEHNVGLGVPTQWP